MVIEVCPTQLQIDNSEMSSALAATTTTDYCFQDPGSSSSWRANNAPEADGAPKQHQLTLNDLSPVNSNRTEPNVILAAANLNNNFIIKDMPSAGETPTALASETADQQQQANMHFNQHLTSANQNGGGQWMLAAAQTTQGMRQRMSLASDQLGLSLRQLYASASSITDVPPSYHNIPGIVPYYHGRSSGPPPSYDDVVNPYAPPPTYQSLFGQMREARKTSRGLVDLLRRLLIILASTLGCTILIAFMIIIPFTMIIVGAIYIDECKVEHIPAFLLLGGLVWASKNLIHCYAQCQAPELSLEMSSRHLDSPGSSGEGGGGGQSNTPPMTSVTSASDSFGGGEPIRESESATRNRLEMEQARGRRLKSSICESLLNCVLFGWFIAGCVIVFRNYEPDFENSASAKYCHKTVYLYTFWLITSAILIFGLFIGCICCLMVSSAIASRQEDDLA